MPNLNATHDATRTSWVASANQDSDFPIQNLPFGVFRRKGGAAQGGVAIGDQIFDLAAALAAGLLSGPAKEAAEAAAGEALNPLYAVAPSAVSALRARLSDLLRVGGPDADKAQAAQATLLVAQADVEMQLPVKVTQFTDFICSADHAKRMQNGTIPQVLQYLPTGYNSRASSIVVSGAPVRRPLAQYRKSQTEILYGPEPMLDYELELGAYIGKGNVLGEPIPIDEAPQYIFGFCLLNDWSARGQQMFESMLGPFLGKTFCTSVSPWIVTSEALAPFGVAAAAREQAPPAHLTGEADQASGSYDIEMEALLSTPKMRQTDEPPARLTRTNYRDMYWTMGQMVTHHAGNGCNLGPGDLIGSGTASGPTDEAMACLAEKTKKGEITYDLPNGDKHGFLEDGDEVIFRAKASAPGAVTIGFGACVGRIAPAPNAR